MFLELFSLKLDLLVLDVVELLLKRERFVVSSGIVVLVMKVFFRDVRDGSFIAGASSAPWRSKGVVLRLLGVDEVVISSLCISCVFRFV